MPLKDWAQWVRWCRLGHWKNFSQLKKKLKKEQLNVCFKTGKPEKFPKYKMENIPSWCAPKGAVWWNISSQEGKGREAVWAGESTEDSSDGHCGRGDYRNCWCPLCFLGMWMEMSPWILLDCGTQNHCPVPPLAQSLSQSHYLFYSWK